MPNYEEVLIKLPAKLLDYARTHQNELEVALRNADKKFAKFLKVIIDDNSADRKRIADKTFEQICQKFFDQSELEHILPQAVRKQFKDKQLSPHQIQTLVLQQMLKKMNKAESLEPVQIILESLNLVATIASTIIICNKLDYLDHKLDHIAKQINDVNQILFETHIRKPCTEIILEYKELNAYVESGSQIEKKDLISTIKKCYHCIDSALSLRNEFALDGVLPVIYSLLPTYSSLIVMYYKQFFYSDKKLHPLHKDWLSIFDKLCNDGLLAEIRDDMILNQHQHDAKATEMLNLHVLLAQGLKSEIELALEDLQKCDDQEDYQNAMALAAQLAMLQMDEAKAELSGLIGKDEASQMVETAKAQALSA